MDTDAATDAKPRKRHDFRHLKGGLYAAKQRPGFQTRIGIPEVGAIGHVNSHAKASSYSSVYALDRVDSQARASSYSSVYALDRVDSQPGRVAIHPFTPLTSLGRICENPC